MAEEATPAVGEEFSRDMLTKMNKQQLVAFAKLTYGLNLVAEQTHKEELIDFIMNAARKFKGNAEMTVVKMGADVEVPPGYVKIRVSPGDHNPNNRPVPIGLNFRMATIPVNRDVVMSGAWLPCLQDAVERRYFVGKDHHGDETLDWNDQHKYPFSILVDNREQTSITA